MSMGEELWNVAGALRHRNDFDRNRVGPINDEIGTERPESDWIRSQVFSHVAGFRTVSQLVKAIEQSLCPAIRCVNTIRRDIFPYFVEIEFSFDAEDIRAQAFFFRRSSDLRASRALATSGPTYFSRSSEASRRPSSPLNSAT